MTVGERDQFIRFIRTLEGITGELKGIRKCLEKIAGDGGETSGGMGNSGKTKNDHREE